MIGAAARPGLRRARAGFVLAVFGAVSVVPAAPAQAAEYGRNCKRIMLSNNAEATMCAFVQSKHGKPGYRGVGTISVDRGTAEMEIGYVQLFYNDNKVRQAGPKATEEAVSLEQKTDWFTPDYGRYRVQMGYRVGTKGGRHQNGAVDSGVWELRLPDENDPAGPMATERTGAGR